MFYLVFLVFVGLGLALKFLNKNKKTSLSNRHVVVTGGSSGIGKAFAILAAQEGAHVSIIARNPEKLHEAEEEIKKHINEKQKVTGVSVDVSAQEAVENSLLNLEQTIGPIYMLVNCAGFSIGGKLEDLTPDQIRQLINVNLLGTIYPTRALVKKFKERGEGVIVITASAVALMGMYGFSIYSACKFALRGFAESLSMELKPYNVSVTLALPPDTDTPGFETENKTKPKETKLISESGGLYPPEAVAKQILNDSLNRHFFSYVGFETYILTTLCVGMSPFHSVVDVLVQSLIMGPFRLVSAFYVKYFERIVYDCYNERQIQDKKD